uniref:Uncharacterized protein n=1 Tax=Oryza rufipogon TaxID=4529 RepID=A0A0E0PYJ0_ORYRU
MDLQIKNVVIVVEMENTNITLIEYFDINQLIPSGGASSCSKHCTPGERAVAVPQLYRLQPRNGLQRRVSRGRLGARRSTAAHRRPSPPAAADHRCLPPPTTAAQRLSPRRGPRADGGMYGSERHPSIPCASSAAHGMATPYCVRQSFGEIGEKEQRDPFSLATRNYNFTPSPPAVLHQAGCAVPSNLSHPMRAYQRSGFGTAHPQGQ